MNRDVFEAVREHNIHADRIRVGWISRIYGERQFIELRHAWMRGGDMAVRELQRFIERLVGTTIQAHHEATGDAREAIRALLPIWERDIYRYMEHLEREMRYRERPFHYGVDPAIGPNDQTFIAYNGRIWNGPPPEDPKAKQKARELLIRNLDAGQEKSFKKDGEFRVTGKDGKAYTIKTARSFNVVGPDGAKYCGQLQDTPIEDQMLAQKLLLEHEPEKFFKNANVSPSIAPGARPEDQMVRVGPWINMARDGGWL